MIEFLHRYLIILEFEHGERGKQAMKKANCASCLLDPLWVKKPKRVGGQKTKKGRWTRKRKG